MKEIKFPKIKLLDTDSDSLNEIPHGNITYVIAFAIPLIMFIALYYARNIFPFGNNCYLRSDMYHQYAPFFSEFWNKLAHGQSLTYSWDIGMGTNFTALYAYYLASPINWLIVLFPQKYIIEIMNVLIILKLSGASAAFTYYIVKHFHTKSCLIALFGTFYAMSGYVAAYNWNIMWLDCIILIPLICLGLEKLVNENKCLLYCFSLGFCIFSNYYISIMVCMTVVIYFIVLMISYTGQRHFKIYLKKIINWIIFSLIAGGLAACLLLPEMYALSLSASSDMSFPKTLSTYFPIMEMLVRQLINVPVHLGLDHYPNIYCGVAIFVLIPLYIMNSKINTRQKVGKVIILLIFLTAFNMNIPNFVWHGLHFPNSLPCRQSFIYIFFLLAMSYEAFHDMDSYTDKQLTGSLWIALLFLILAEQLYAGDTYKFKIMYISGAFILIYMLLMYLHRRNQIKKPVLVFLLFTFAIIECTINMEETGLSTTIRTYYVNDNNAVNNVNDYVSQNDTSFYRIEKVSGLRTKNDAAWHNYKSISTFSSTANAGITDILGKLGCEHSTNAYAFKGSTLFTDAIFDVKYLLGNKLLTESNLLKLYYSNDGEFLYQNQYTLPVGFMVKQSINDDWKLDSIGDAIQIQNDFIQLNTGISDVFKQIYEFHSESDTNIVPTMNGHMYLIAKNQNLKTMSVSINGTTTIYSDLENSNYTIDIGYVLTTDIIVASAETSMNLSVYTLDSNKFTSAINAFKQGALNVTSFSDTKIEGTVNAMNDGVMFFSIPFDKGWTVRVDGKAVDTFAIKDALLGINVGAGTHTITLSYTPVGLVKGILISILCLLILVAFIIFRNREKAGRTSVKNLPVFLQEMLSQDDVILKSTPLKDKLASMIGLTTVNADVEADITNNLLDDVETNITHNLATDVKTYMNENLDVEEDSDYNAEDNLQN